MPPLFSPLHRTDGYLPIEDHGLIGDGSTAALVGRDGAIAWMCVPRFDAEPLFSGLLDARRGGAFTVAPEGLVESRQYYEPDSAVLVTEMRSPTGLVRVTDALTLTPGADLTATASLAAGALLRSVEVIEGRVRLRVTVEPRGGSRTIPDGGGLKVRCLAHPGLELILSGTRPLDGLSSAFDLEGGDRACFTLQWGNGDHAPPLGSLDETRRAWRRWMEHLDYRGPQEALVRRSAITLKLLDHFENGSIVAAPTSSLPAPIGGSRNWDYRYTWIRDAAFSTYAFRRIGLEHEAEGFLAWALKAAKRAGRLKVLYGLDGCEPPPEREDPDLEGYRRSRPVRWGNAAADQRQHDVYGEILDCAYLLARGGQVIEASLWERLRGFVEQAREEWHEPDHGIWEVRSSGRVFTYSAALCHVALDRGVRLAGMFGLAGNVEGWKAEADKIRHAILEKAWDAKLGAITEHVDGGGGGLDASLLSLPLRRVIPPDHPRMVATTNAIADRLSAGDGLLYRYITNDSPDGLPGHEGAFVICSFWLVDNLSQQGRLDEAMALYDSLCARAGTLGLLPEQIDPGSGAFMGNYPQAFSHIGMISSGVNLGRRLKERQA